MGVKYNTIQNVIKFTFSRDGFWLKVKYFLLSLIFTPFLLSEEINKDNSQGSASEESLAGDDIYPLF